MTLITIITHYMRDKHVYMIAHANKMVVTVQSRPRDIQYG